MTSSTRNTRIAAIAAVAVLGLSACSSASDGATAEPAASTGVELPTVSAAVFAEQGNEICRTSSEAIGAKFREMSTPPTEAELTAAYDNMLKESYKLVGELLAVGPPEGQERDLLDLLVQQHKITETVEDQGQAAFFADEDSDPWAELVDTLVDDFGLSECGRGE